MKKFIILIFMSILFSNYTFANDYIYVDKYQKKVDEKEKVFIKNYVDKCVDDGKLNKYSCKKLARHKAEEKYLSRGSKAYIEKHYKSLSRKEAKAAAIKILELYKKIENQPSGHWDGKIGEYDLDIEAAWLAEHKLGVPDALDAVSLMPYVGVDY